MRWNTTVLAEPCPEVDGCRVMTHGTPHVPDLLVRAREGASTFFAKHVDGFGPGSDPLRGA
ncbi:predicted protein [Streptomyces viridosporus ATCC 14672]|uniref:Predicted protein n=1 Tax=Streptomyces viridosporus (strain ATCC 14672 / DSM 40746 / JCM 4963 / KCTC 9882 / NRRL B-12104 / FH 1290) TaxID=566461 RepID=D6A5U1_STRV1|nr:predicted protein [Streptomyces viridosporus ATCC 14672]